MRGLEIRLYVLHLLQQIQGYKSTLENQDPVHLFLQYSFLWEAGEIFLSYKNKLLLGFILL